MGPGVTRVTALSEYNPTNPRHGERRQHLHPRGQGARRHGVRVRRHARRGARRRLAAWLLVEHATLERGRLIVALSANRSASTVTRPSAAYPATYTIPTVWAARPSGWAIASPTARPVARPEVFIHYPSGQYLAYVDVRNLNRAFPGRPGGTLTERTTHAFMELVRRERVDVAIDLHEAELQYPVINTIVTHQKGQELATMISMTLTDLEGFNIGTEFSPLNLHGLTHREIGDHSQAVSLLFEAPEPFLDATRGARTPTCCSAAGRVRREGRQEGPALRADRRKGVAHRQPRRPPYFVCGADARDLDRVQPGSCRRREEHSALRGAAETWCPATSCGIRARPPKTASPTNSLEATAPVPTGWTATAFRSSAADPRRPGPRFAAPSAARAPRLLLGLPGRVLRRRGRENPALCRLASPAALVRPRS